MKRLFELIFLSTCALSWGATTSSEPPAETTGPGTQLRLASRREFIRRSSQRRPGKYRARPELRADGGDSIFSGRSSTCSLELNFSINVAPTPLCFGAPATLCLSYLNFPYK